MRCRSILGWMFVAGMSFGLYGCGGGDGGGSSPPPADVPKVEVQPPADPSTIGGAPLQPAKGWGTLTGVFHYNGAVPEPTPLTVDKDVEVCGKHPLVDESLVVGADGGIANVVIYVRTKDVEVHEDYADTAGAKVTYDNKGCRFEPHVLPIRVSQTLVLHNSDTVGHNSNLQPLGDQGSNPLIPAGNEVEHKFNRPQNIPVPVTCNIHPWMKGYIFPRENPYVAVSGADGSFKLENLPAGELEFQVWQEKAGYVETPDWSKGRFTMTIKPGNNDLGTIELSPDLFNK